MIHCCFYFGSYTVVVHPLRFLNHYHPVTLVIKRLSNSHFGSYIVVIQLPRFLHHCHPVTLVLTSLSFSHFGSYTVTHSDSYTISFYDSYIVYHFILWFLHCFSLCFTVLIPLLFLLGLIPRSLLLGLTSVFLPMMIYLVSVLTTMTIKVQFSTIQV